MNNKRKHDKKPGHPTPAATPFPQAQQAQVAQGFSTAAGDEQQALAYNLYTASCLFHQAYNGFILALLCGAEWNTPEEVAARGWTLVDTGFTVTPPGATGGPGIKIQQVKENNRDTAVFFLRPPHGKGVLVPILGDLNSGCGLYYMNMAEKIAITSIYADPQRSGAIAPQADTGATMELNSFLEFCKTFLVSERTLCPSCMVKIGWGKNKSFGTDQFRVSDLFSEQTDQPVPLCLLFRVRDDHGVLLNCDYDTAIAEYDAAAEKAAPDIDLFESDWVKSLFKETHASHIYRGPRP
jgi:hypothetical protein